jgi:outer membrane protein assembly factor BamB
MTSFRSTATSTLYASFLCALCVFAAISSAAFAEDWPQWRGPRGDGTSTETAVPTHWSTTDNVKWKVPLSGKGHGSPIVVGGRIFLNTALEQSNKRILLCLDRKTGQTLWQTEVLTAPLEQKNKLNNYASSTPACDGQRVFVTFQDGKQVLIAAYDMDGKQLWRKTESPFYSPHGWSCSPMLYGDSIIVNCDHDGPGYIVRLRRDTGQEVWRIERPNHTRSYCNPTIFDVNGEKQMVLSGTKCTTSYDPDTGKLRWLVDGPTEQYVASMVYTQGVFCITAGFPEMHTLGIAPDGKTLWHHAKVQGLAAYVPSPVAFDKWFFLVTDGGNASCLDAKTGAPLWSQRLGKHHFPSGVLADGNVYWLSDEGICYVVKAGDKYELIARNELGEHCNASPVISNGQLFIRTADHFWCIGD